MPENGRLPLKKLNANYLYAIAGGGTTSDNAVDFVIRSYMAKAAGKRPAVQDVCSRIEGVRNLRKELGLNRGRNVLAELNGGQICRWGTVAKSGDVLVVEPFTSSLNIEVYKDGVLNINTDGFHRGYDPAIYRLIYELSMNVPYVPQYRYVFGEEAENAIKELENMHCGD